MTDTLVGKTGKHAALWERMRSQNKRPQMIHRPKPKETTKESRDISMTVTMSPDHSQESSVLMGMQIHQDDDEQQQQETVQPISLSASTNEHGIGLDQKNVADSILKTPAAKQRAPDFASGLTPGVLWKDWQQQQQDGKVQEGNISILNHSIISDDSSTSHGNAQNDETKLSLPDSSVDSPPIPMTPGTQLLLTASPTSPLTAMRRNSMHQELQETNVYIKRIQQLEEALRNAQTKEPLPKAQSTPSNLPSFHDTPSPLLERNKTLVKEIRFAEQTCVELSQRNAALEQELERLDETLAESRREHEVIHKELVQSNRDCATLQAEKDALQVTLASEREQRLRLEQTLETLPQDEKENCCELSTTTPNKTSRSSPSSSSSPTSQVLAKTLQTQLQRGYSDNDKLLELEAKLAESNKALQEAQRELAQHKRTQDAAETSNSSMMSSELELARAQAKLASVSKELQAARIAESSTRHALSQARVEIDAFQREKEQLVSGTPLTSGGSTKDRDALPRQFETELQATVERLTQECRDHDAAALEASNKIKALEYELKLAREQVALERERLQEEFFDMTQAALSNVERQSTMLDQKVKARTEQFSSRLASLSSAVQHIQDSLDFQSETGSSCDSSHVEEESLRGEHGVEASDNAQGDEDSRNDGTVLNATFHQSQSGTRSIHEEMLLEQMEEARPVDQHADAVGHDMIEDLSFIADLSHLYEDLSGLLMHDPMSPARQADVGLPSASPAIKSIANVSSAEKSSVHSSLESVEHDFVRLKSTIERVQRATAKDDHVLLETIEEQTQVIHSLEQKLGDLADESEKSEGEHRQLNVAVLEMSKAYSRCQTELKETSAALTASQEAQTQARSEIEQTLERLLEKLQEKERLISVLQNEQERLSSTIRQFTDSSEELSRKQQEEHINNNKLEVATKSMEKLGQELERRSVQLEDAMQSCDLLSRQVDGLESLRQTHETRISQLQESITSLETAKAEIEEKYNEASSILRALSREREHQKQDLLAVEGSKEELRRECALGAETISTQKEQLEKLKSEREETLQEKAKLSNTVDELMSARSELLSEVDTLKDALSLVESELDYLKVSYITCNDKLADASEKNASKDELVAKFKSSTRAAKVTISSYEERLSTLTVELEKSESERAALNEQLVAMEEELRATADDFVSYKNDMEKKLSERNDLIDVVQSTSEALKSTYEHKLASLTTQQEVTDAETNQVVTDFMIEFRSAFTDSLESLSQIGVSLDVGDVMSGLSQEGTLTWSQSLKTATQYLAQWKQVVVECSEVIFEYQERLQKAEEQAGTLANEAYRFKDAGSKIEDKLREQQRQSENLSTQLRLAESEAAKSAAEVAKVQSVLSATKRELVHASQQLANQTDLKEQTEGLIMERDEAECRAFEMKKTLTVLEEKLKGAVDESARLKERIQEKDEVARDLESQNLSLDRKCQRLRDYIRKLTMKCEEWAEYSEKQSEAIKKAKDRQQAGIETGAHTLSCSKTVAETPHGAAAQESSQDRSRWSVERRMLDRVANLAATLD